MFCQLAMNHTCEPISQHEGSRVARALSWGDKLTARVHYEGEEERNILRSSKVTNAWISLHPQKPEASL